MNDNEYQAAVTFLEPPSERLNKSVVFPSAGTVLGNFANHKTALIQTDVGAEAGEYIQDAINAKFVIGVGVGYAFDREKYNLVMYIGALKTPRVWYLHYAYTPISYLYIATKELSNSKLTYRGGQP